MSEETEATSSRERFEGRQKAYWEASQLRTIAELQPLSDQEIIRLHDDIARAKNYLVDIDFYLNELARRENDRVAKKALWLTAAATILAVAAFVTSVLQVILAISE